MVAGRGPPVLTERLAVTEHYEVLCSSCGVQFASVSVTGAALGWRAPGLAGMLPGSDESTAMPPCPSCGVRELRDRDLAALRAGTVAGVIRAFRAGASRR